MIFTLLMIFTICGALLLGYYYGYTADRPTPTPPEPPHTDPPVSAPHPSHLLSLETHPMVEVPKPTDIMRYRQRHELRQFGKAVLKE